MLCKYSILCTHVGKHQHPSHFYSPVKRFVQFNLLEMAVEQFVHVVSFTLLRLAVFQHLARVILLKEIRLQIERSVLQHKHQMRTARAVKNARCTLSHFQ